MECSVCGNSYDRPLRIEVDGAEARVFDCFECAIQALAPTCPHCGVRVIGHGVETSDGSIYCCAHCARQHGHTGMADHQPASAVSGSGSSRMDTAEGEAAVSGSGLPPQ